MNITPSTEVEVPVLVSSKKQRSARSSGKKGWTPAVPEIRRLVGCSYSNNNGFSANMLVWAKLDGGPWWPARVVSVDEIPEDLKKQEEGWTCVKYYGVTNTKSFAWLKAEGLSTFEKNFKEFSQQSIPSDFSGGSFKAALIEIKESAGGKNAKATSRASSGTAKHQESQVLQAYAYLNERVVNKDGAHVGDVIEPPLKRRKLKFKGVERVPVLNDDLNAHSKGKEAPKDLKGQERIVGTKSKRRRMAKQPTEPDEDGAATRESLELPSKKFGFPTLNSSSLSSRDLVKKTRGKKTGADGYYFECMVCDIGGNLLCCDLCPRVYHLECLNPPLKRTPPGKWFCPVCHDTPGALKAFGSQTSDSKPRFKTTSESQATAVVQGPKTRPGPKRGWKLFHRGKQLTPDLDLRKLRKRKREEDTERARKKLNLKLNRPLSSQSQPKCRQCGAGINSSGESPSNVFCKECVELVKRNLHPTGRMVLPRKDMIPTRHSKLKPGKCDICSKPGLVIFCDVCPRGFHKDCLNPPRKRAPKGAWSCPKCGPMKDVKEGKDAKEVQEGRDAPKDVQAGKIVKAAKLVKDTEEQQDGKDEQHLAAPSLEVDRILGCRVSLSCPSTGELVESMSDGISGDGTPLGPLENVLKSELGGCTPGAKSEEGKVIEIRLPICGAEQIEKDISANLGPNEATSAPGLSAVIGGGSDTVNDVEYRSASPVMVARDDTAAGVSSRTKSGGLDLRIATDVPLELKKSLRVTQAQSGFKAVKGVLSDEKDQESGIVKDGLQRSLSAEAAGKEESGSVESFSKMTTCSESRDTNCADMAVVNVNASKLLSPISDGTEKGDLDDRSSLELMTSAKDISVSDEIQLPVNDTLGGKVVKDSLLPTEDMAIVSTKDVSNRFLSPPLAHPELEFLVKWAGRAHIHNEWVKEERLRSIAKRKLENFKLKHGNAPKMLVEDKWVKPQRIVAKRAVHGKGYEVLVKWSGLSYEECTWERVEHPVIVTDAELIGLFEHFEQEARSLDAELAGNDADILDPFFWRGQRLTEVETIKDQPEYLKGGSLFPHQMEALNWLRKCWHRERSVILADEMGLGKTISACSFIASLRHEFKVKAPCLVLVPLSTMPNWLAEFAIWAPSLNVIEYHGSAKAKALIREYEWHVDALDSASKKLKRTFKFHVMLTTYEMVIADSSQLRAVPWDVLVVDEGHRLKNSSSKLFTLLNTFSFSHRVLLTGTPLQNNFGEMFNLLNFLQPNMFPSLAAFQDKFSSLSTAEQVEELKKLVAPNMLRRLKKDAMQKIPPKTELVVPVDMNSVQIEYYKALLTRNYQVLRNGGKHQSMLNILMQLRKVCNHPYLIAGTEPDTGTPEFLQEMRIKASAKLMLLHSMLGKLKADGHRVLIFSQMTKLLDILEDYLSFEFGQDAFERVDGSVSVAERQTAIARFNHDTSRFVFLLSTRACGLGINLATADTVIIYDSDFNPQADIQAMNRAHRIGQSKTLLVYRLVVRASVEERILQLAKKKLMLDHLFANKTGSQKEVDDILRWGTEELFQETSVPPDGPGSGPGISDKGDDGEAKQRKKGGELGDMYGGYYLQLGRSKVVWDDAAVNRLLDRSDLNTCHSEVAQGEPESDVLGSLKAWDWNDQDAVPEEQDGEEALGKEGEVEKLPKTPATEGENQWDKLLRSRWETLQTDEEAALGRGKRNRKVVSYIESNGQKSKELLSEVSDAEEDASEPDYTPVGRALKQKLSKLRARQKDRILQRYSNEAVRSVDGEKLAVAAGMPWEGTGLAVPIVEGGDCFKRSCKDHGQAMRFGAIAPAIGSSSMGHLFGKPALDASAISLTTVSQELESGQSLSQLLPALRQSLQGVQYANSLQSSAPVQSDFRSPTAAAGEGASNNNSSQEGSGLNAFSRPANGAKSMFSLEAMKALAGYQYKCKPPDIVLEFSQKIFGGEKNFSTSDTLSAGGDLSGQRSEQGIVIPSTSLSQEDNSVRMLQRSHRAPGLGVSLLPSTQGPGTPNLSIALGLQVIDTSPNGDVRDSQISTAAPSSTSISSGGSIKIADIQGVERVSHTSSLFHKLGTKHMIPIELNDNDSEPIVSTRRFLSPGVVEGAMGRSWHTEDQRKCREQGSQAWSEDELDALWTGVRRHGLGNWAAMLLDSKLCFLKSRSVGELADRWKDEQMKMFGNPQQLSEARRKPPNSWTGGTAMSGMGSHPERGFSDTFGIEQGLERSSGTERGLSHTGGTERGLSHTSVTEWGRPSHTEVLLTSSGITESAVVHPDDKFFSRYQEKDSFPWVPDLEIKLPAEKQPYYGTSKAGGPSTLSGLQFVNKTSDFGRLEPSSQACSYRNLLVDFRSSRSSPSIPTSIPGKRTPAAGPVPATNVGSFGLSSEGICRFNDNSSRTNGTDQDQIVAEFGTSLSPRLGLGSDWRRQEAKERTSWQQQLPSFSSTDSGRCLSSLPELSGALRSEEPHLRIQVSLAPSPRLGSPPRNYLGNKALVSLPHNGGAISITEHRRRARGGSSVKAMSSINADEAAPSSLPHWLREVVKARSAPPQPPLPSAIAAVVQATNILYKNSSRLLPPLVHPGYPLVPPREFPKKVRRRQHQKISHQQSLGRTERVPLGHPSPSVDFSPPIKVEGLNQPLVSLPRFDSGGAVNSRPLPALGPVNSSILWSKGFPEFPLLPSLDHSKRRQTSHIPSDSLSELMATRRSIIELGLMAGLHPSIVSALNMDELNIHSSSIGKGRRPWPDFGSDLGRVWKVSQSLPDSLLTPSSSLAPSAPVSSERHFSRSSQGVMSSQASPVGRKGEASLSDPEKKSQLPQWLLSVDGTTTASDGGPEHQPEVGVGDNDNESTSSKTVSDPGVRSKCCKDNEHSDDASSEETISDDGTQ